MSCGDLDKLYIESVGDPTPIFIPFLEFIFRHSSSLVSEQSPLPEVDSPSWHAVVSYCNEPAIFR